MTSTAQDDCKTCFGMGTEPQVQPAVFGEPIKPMPTCSTCKGTGKRLGRLLRASSPKARG
jgi:DnaJ-class molecular chaperone